MFAGCIQQPAKDIVFASSLLAKHKDTKRTLSFFRRLIDTFQVGKNQIRVGLVPSYIGPVKGIFLNQFHDKQKILHHISEFHKNTSTTASVLKYMRTISFNTHNGARQSVKRVALVVVDRNDKHLHHLQQEALRLRVQKNVEIFVVGVGKQMATRQLEIIASKPVAQHLFHISSYKELKYVEQKLTRIGHNCS